MLVASIALSASACGPVTTLRRVGATVRCHPSGCAFDVVTSRPARDYRVIAVLDVEAFAVKRVPNTEEKFRAAIAKDVCSVGGDAVIPGINVDGRYVLATVIAWLPDFPPAPAPEPPVPLPMPEPLPLPTMPTEGCGGNGPC